MERKAMFKKFEYELKESRQNFLKGKCIPLEEFDWGLPQIPNQKTIEFYLQNEIRNQFNFADA